MRARTTQGFFPPMGHVNPPNGSVYRPLRYDWFPAFSADSGSRGWCHIGAATQKTPASSVHVWHRVVGPETARPYGVPGASLVSWRGLPSGVAAAVEPQLREAPVMSEGSWVGLDVHARSVVAGVIDAGSGEVRSLRVPPGCDGDGGVVEDAAGAGSGRVRGGADRVRACACVCRGGDQLRCGGAVADPAGGRPGQDRPA